MGYILCGPLAPRVQGASPLNKGDDGGNVQLEGGSSGECIEEDGQRNRTGFWDC